MKDAPFSSALAMEHTGIEPVTSGLQSCADENDMIVAFPQNLPEHTRREHSRQLTPR